MQRFWCRQVPATQEVSRRLMLWCCLSLIAALGKQKQRPACLLYRVSSGTARGIHRKPVFGGGESEAGRLVLSMASRPGRQVHSVLYRGSEAGGITVKRVSGKGHHGPWMKWVPSRHSRGLAERCQHGPSERA